MAGTKCAFCSGVVNGREDFRDDLSCKEFQISGLCQSCQDETFSKKRVAGLKNKELLDLLNRWSKLLEETANHSTPEEKEKVLTKVNSIVHTARVIGSHPLSIIRSLLKFNGAFIGEIEVAMVIFFLCDYERRQTRESVGEVLTSILPKDTKPN